MSSSIIDTMSQLNIYNVYNLSKISLSERINSQEEFLKQQMHIDDPNYSKTYSEKSKINLQNEIDRLMLSDNAISMMNQINGTDKDDVIIAKTHEDGSITFDINGEKQIFSKEEVANGFFINAENGNDKIDISQTNANIIINSGDGNNNVSLGSGRNIFMTKNGNNTIKGNKNASKCTFINTGSGNNYISLGKNSVNTIITNGGANKITVDEGSISYINDRNNTNKYSTIKLNTDKYNFVKTTGKSKITVGNGNNEIENSNGSLNLKAGNGNNKIIGGEKGNKIKVGNGNNYIEGSSNNDVILAGNGNNNIYGLGGNDIIFVGNGNNYIDGGKGNDTILAGKGKNIIIGGLGDNLIVNNGKGGTIIDNGTGSKIYSKDNNIKLYDPKETSSLGKSIKINGNSQFQQRIQSDLEVFKATQSGKKLLSELDKSNHKIIIENNNSNNGLTSAYNKNDTPKAYAKEDGTRGEGTDVWIELDTTTSDYKNIRPANTFYHELVHAYNITTGTILNKYVYEKKSGETIHTAEYQAIGLDLTDFTPIEHPDGTISTSNPKGISENDFIEEIGLERRTSYIL